MTPFYNRDGIEIYNTDCMDLLESLKDSSIDLIVTDPPYFKVKADWWDRQWDKPEAFLSWMGELCDEWKRVLKPNGSLYVFASPQMAWGVEGEVRKRFNVLNRIRWRKPSPKDETHYGSSRADMACKDAFRGFFPAGEELIFAEQFGSDDTAGEQAGYRKKCDEAARDVFGKYITATRKRHYLTMKDLTGAIGAHGAVNHGGACSNWEAGYNVPTREHYDTLQVKFPGCFDREYEDLRREYEDLRREYEDLRRPFSVTADVPYTDVWDFPTVQAYDGKHPCEKPLAMMEHIITASSKPGATVLDCFSGSGVVGEACRNFGRQAILCEIDIAWCKKIKNMLRQGSLFAVDT